MSRLMTKPTKRHARPAKTQIRLGIRPVWSESSLSTWRKLGSLATQWAHSKDTDQPGRIPRLIWVFTGRTVILLVLTWGGSVMGKQCRPRLNSSWKSSLIRVCTVCHSICIHRTHFSVVKSHCWSFRIITAIFSGAAIPHCCVSLSGLLWQSHNLLVWPGSF